MLEWALWGLAVFTVGAVKGMVKGHLEGDAAQSSHRKGFAAGVRHAKAQHLVKWRKIVRKIEQLRPELEDDNQYFALLVGLYAISIAAAHADGRFTESEECSIREFIAGISHVALPKRVQTSFKRISSRPPTLQTALRFVRRIPKEHWPLVGDVIDFVINADGKVSAKEEAFRQAWSDAAAA